MIDFLFPLFIGLMLGWFFLPTPAWAKSIINWITEKVPFLANFLKE